jgi:hypothetical protein
MPNSSLEFLFAEDLKIYLVMKSAEDLRCLQTNIIEVKKWCFEIYCIQN